MKGVNNMLTMLTIFKSKNEAEKVLQLMKEVIRDYGNVTLADYYDLVDFGFYSMTATHIGWSNLDDAKISKGKGTGWTLTLPEHNYME